MTLILAIPNNDGIVFASDGQVTSGEVRATGQKLFKLNQCCAWGASGELALIQRVNEAISGMILDLSLDELRDQLANSVKQCVTSLLQLDFRTQFFQGNPQGLLSLHPGDFVFVECRRNNRILHITSYGTPEWIDRPFASGNGANFAYALLQKCSDLKLSMDQASLLAFKVIEEAIDVGAYGLGPPIKILHIASHGITELGDEKIAALGDAARILRQAELELLQPNSETVVPQPDVGLSSESDIIKR